VNTPLFPDPRTVAGWWSRLAPAAVAAGSFTVLRVEVLVETPGDRPLDPLTRAVLAVAATADPPSPPEIARRLGLDDLRTRLVLADAVRSGWLDRAGAERFHPIPAGREAESAGAAAVRLGRQRFAFRDASFVPLSDPGPLRFTASRGSAAPPRGFALVRAAFARPEGWKREAGFPTSARLADAEALPESDRWRAVPLEREEAFTAVVASAADGSVTGFLTGPPDWSLGERPAFGLCGAAAREAFPELFADPLGADADAAWREWAAARGAGPDELAECRVRVEGHRLAVDAPARLADRLRADTSAAEGWVWVGGGPVRRAAVPDVRG
jgi:hypothetical protein